MCLMGLDKESTESILFSVYLDDLSNELNNIKAMCYIGEVLLNHLMFAGILRVISVCFVQVYDGCIQCCGVGVVRSGGFWVESDS